MPDTTVTPGKETSEHAAMKESSFIGKVLVVLGLLVTVGGSIAPLLGKESDLAIVVGAVLIIAGAFEDMLIKLGYTKSRTLVKASASQAAVKIAEIAAYSPKASGPAQ